MGIILRVPPAGGLPDEADPAVALLFRSRQDLVHLRHVRQGRDQEYGLLIQRHITHNQLLQGNHRRFVVLVVRRWNGNVTCIGLIAGWWYFKATKTSVIFLSFNSKISHLPSQWRRRISGLSLAVISAHLSVTLHWFLQKKKQSKRVEIQTNETTLYV